MEAFRSEKSVNSATAVRYRYKVLEYLVAAATGHMIGLMSHLRDN